MVKLTFSLPTSDFYGVKLPIVRAFKTKIQSLKCDKSHFTYELHMGIPLQEYIDLHVV